VHHCAFARPKLAQNTSQHILHHPTADQRSTYFRISHIFRFPHFFSISTLFFFNIYFFDGFHFIDAHPKLGQKTPQTPFFQVETGSTHVDPPIFRKNGVYWPHGWNFGWRAAAAGLKPLAAARPSPRTIHAHLISPVCIYNSSKVATRASNADSKSTRPAGAKMNETSVAETSRLIKKGLQGLKGTPVSMPIKQAAVGRALRAQARGVMPVRTRSWGANCFEASTTFSGYTRIRMHMHKHTWIFIGIYTCICMHAYKDIFIYICIYMCIYICVSVYFYVHTCM